LKKKFWSENRKIQSQSAEYPGSLSNSSFDDTKKKLQKRKR